MTTSATEPQYTVPPSGYRLPGALRLGPVRLQVADLDRSLTYYQRVLGLRVVAREAGRAVLGAGTDPTPLVELHERPGAAPVPRRGRLGLYHFALLLPDRAALGRLLIHLASLGVRPGMSDHLVSEAIYLTDPDGLGIEVYADRPRDQWKMDGTGIAMATLPLDVDDLIAAAGSEPWTGAPAGTRIGHVHLFVGNLDESAEFFHRGLGLDRVVLNFPGALFLSAGGYHHHLGTNVWASGAPRPTDADARLLEWTALLPAANDVDEAAASIAAGGSPVERDGGDAIATDPWGTRVRLTSGAPYLG